MSALREEIRSAEVPAGAVRLWWLGQAGFAFRAPDGTVVFLDPYLSDSVERLHGFKRLSLAPIAPDEVDASLVVLTHEHTDHLDPDTLPVIARDNPGCKFAAPAGCEDGLAAAGIAGERWIHLAPRREHRIGPVKIRTAQADHGDLSPTALALLLDFGGVRIFCSGDTCWRPEQFAPLFDPKPDVVLPCINGVFGNMGHIDAAMLVQQAGPRYAIPCHYWTFAEQGGGDPAGFLYACRQFAPNTQAMLLRPGEGLTVTPA